MKLQHIQILTNNIQQTAKFYNDILELPIIEKTSKSVTIKAGNSILKFVENPDFNSMYHFAFNIPENKLEEAIAWCNDKIDLVIIEDKRIIANFETWNANAVYFYDNNGNLLEFIARHDLDNSQIKQFSSKSILNISEIGLANEDPIELGTQLIEDYNLSFFAKNFNSEAFAAIGDDEGLLIIVKPNRNWYPTQTPSKSNKTEIRIENNNDSIHLSFE
ncbi:catechol-2,3-dioxygenase [Flavobacterium sp. 90]|uniref:VOC family protein n=1 Tax=unclassified Flavobacterium TaxID=196869 RepID=UPI000EB3708D|nr:MULTISPECIES: VOC family protein [unclassified Flavobacterium]RKR05823.1 catechol-2,3-dioxygenase [Flavobacterium sp. 81]TCK57134.1 catechol-2,3-dioxygenase [Flavobacterium sp. 90]